MAQRIGVFSVAGLANYWGQHLGPEVGVVRECFVAAVVKGLEPGWCREQASVLFDCWSVPLHHRR